MNSKFSWNDKINKATQMLLVVSDILIAIFLLIQNITIGWEKWMIPVLAVVVLMSVGIHFAGAFTENGRKLVFSFIMLILIFYYGAHSESVYEIPIIVALAMTIFSMTLKIYLIYLSLAVGIGSMVFHMFLVGVDKGFVFEHSGVIRFIWQVVAMVVTCVAVLYLSRVWKDTGEHHDVSIAGLERKNVEKLDMLDRFAQIMKKKIDNGEDVREELVNLNEYIKCERGELVLNEQTYETAMLVNVSKFNTCAQEKGLNFNFSMDSEMPRYLIGDFTIIRKVLSLLTDNSFKYTKKGNVYIKMGFLERDYGINLRVEIADTGRGFETGMCEAVFSRTGWSSNFENEGIGIGIPLANGYLNVLGGFMSAVSEKDVGTKVLISIPQKTANNTDVV